MKKLLLFLVLCSISSCVSDDFNNMAEGFAPPTLADAFEMAQDPHDPDQRRKGLTLLSNAPFGGGSQYQRIYREFIEKEDDPLVRAAAIKALARFGNADDALIILPWLSMDNTQSEQVRRAAARALQRFYNPSVVPALLRTLRNQEEQVQARTNVAIALGQYAEKRVFNGLILGLQANNLSLNLAAAQSLHVLTGQVFGIDWDGWYEWSDKPGTDIFAFQSAYTYPTYKHEESWWDNVTFWEYRIHEKPDYPAGSKEATKMSTYDDAVETSQ
jgi:hypothetical protein